MAEIQSFGVMRHLRGESTSHVLFHRRGHLAQSGRGLSLWFVPLSASIAEIPLDDRELPFLFHGRSVDFQDVTTQGVVTYRVIEPEVLARRVDFSIDLRRGVHREQPLEKLSVLFTQLAQQLAWAYIAHTPLRAVLSNGVAEIRRRILEGLHGDESIAEMGLEVVSVRVSGVLPTAELEQALQTPTLEKIQEEADEAIFQRRALAVEKERAIQENELQNRIELARKEEELITQQGANARRRATEDAEAERIATDAEAARRGVESAAQADAIRVVQAAKVNAEKERMDIYREMPATMMVGLAARELAGKLRSIEHLNVTPELFGPLVTELLQAGTARLREGNGHGNGS